jgi:glycosyltransferase involved in cell wall biosynthesis
MSILTIEKPIITFIIPTIGRESLQNSINSLLNQTITKWNALIIFDGIEINIVNNDERIKIIKIEKLGLNINSAGLVRNYAMSLVKTDWIAFLDDDDIISNDYIEIFYKEFDLYSELDLIIFRMKYFDRIVPKLDTNNFYICDVGISFIIRKKIYDDGLIFIPDGAEDFLYLDKIRNNGYKIIISPYTKYFVRTNETTDDLILGSRIFINFDNDLNNNDLNNNDLNNNNLKILIGYLLVNKYIQNE